MAHRRTHDENFMTCHIPPGTLVGERVTTRATTIAAHEGSAELALPPLPDQDPKPVEDPIPDLEAHP